MNVPWNWIEQRPHIIAKMLAEHYKVSLAVPQSIYRFVTSKCSVNIPQNMTIVLLWTLPSKICQMFPVLRKLCDWINAVRLKGKGPFDVIWTSHPDHIFYVNKISKEQTNHKAFVIYDCMDDHAAMAKDWKTANKILLNESDLIRRADIVYVSSEFLMEKVARSDSIVVRNGFKGENLHPVSEPSQKSFYTIGYFGTVAKWFDFESISSVVNNIDNIRFRIVGPTEHRMDIPRVDYMGPVDHSELFHSVEDCSCLIMPFIVNDIIKAVDPVKLYEYIAFGKCVISVRYPEIERFGDYVYFYETSDELVSLISDLSSKGFPPKYTEASRRRFLSVNTWEQRVNVIVQTLEGHGFAPNK